MTREELPLNEAEALDGILLRSLQGPHAVCKLRDLDALEAALLRYARHLDLGKLRFLHINEFHHDVTALLSGTVDAVPMFSAAKFTL